MSVISGPPVLTVGHQGMEIPLERLQIKLAKLLGVVEFPSHWTCLRRILVQYPYVKLVGPPITVRLKIKTRVDDRASGSGAVVVSVHIPLRRCSVARTG